MLSEEEKAILCKIPLEKGISLKTLEESLNDDISQQEQTLEDAIFNKVSSFH